ncbi:hypothetical protein [Desulfosporosinus sp. BG]|uniref:hypothetical protein n=1 Tax=Desulfosporosinus sp. BG TaxID=1633135 RepID=UPI000858EB0D|nr:hypothetical protein [Desulfosporosinus sp. BG]ODA41072.1 hypothetical protein DSBG_2110 [Desulfosporosinus sp. BG]
MLKKLWSLVNNAQTLNDVNIAELEIRKADISIVDYDDLMMSLSYVSRELHRQS